MEKVDELYGWLDVGALYDPDAEASRADKRPDGGVGAASSCRGKVLLLLTSQGLELVRVPELLN